MGSEFWKDVVGYEGLYQVSNLGKVRSVDRVVDCRWGHNKKLEGKEIKSNLDKDGYLKLALSKYGKRKTYAVHRLVADAFIPNPHNLPCINHKKEFEKTNNSVENLEWCTVKYNNNYGTHQERSAKAREGMKNVAVRGGLNGNAKSVMCLNDSAVFDTLTLAAKQYGCNISCVSQVCSGKRNSTNGYKFAFC